MRQHICSCHTADDGEAEVLRMMNDALADPKADDTGAEDEQSGDEGNASA